MTCPLPSGGGRSAPSGPHSLLRRCGGPDGNPPIVKETVMGDDNKHGGGTGSGQGGGQQDDGQSGAGHGGGGSDEGGNTSDGQGPADGQ